MKNNMIGVIIAVVCAIILAGSVLVPFVDNVTATTKTYYNEGLPYTIADADDTDTHTILVSLVDGSYAVTLDGDAIDDSGYGSSYMLLLSEHALLRYSPASGVVYMGGTQSSGTSPIWKGFDAPTDGAPITITIVGTTATVTGLQSGSSVSYTVADDFAYVSTDGSYRFCANPYVTAESVVYGGEVFYSPFSSATVICFNGTVENMTGGVYRSSPAATLDSITVNTSGICTDLLRIDSVVFNCTQSNNSVSATCLSFLAPYEVVYQNPDYVGSTESALIGIIPLLCVVLIVMAFIYAVFRGRDY